MIIPIFSSVNVMVFYTVLNNYCMYLHAIPCPLPFYITLLPSNPSFLGENVFNILFSIKSSSMVNAITHHAFSWSINSISNFFTDCLCYYFLFNGMYISVLNGLAYHTNASIHTGAGSTPSITPHTWTQGVT